MIGTDTGDDAQARVQAHTGGRGAHVIVLAGAVAVLIVGLLVAAAGPLLYRGGVLELDAAREGTQSLAGMLAGLAGAIALVGLAMSVLGKSSKGAIVGVLVIIAALLLGFRVVGAMVQRSGLPPIHDAQTDWDNPVAFTGRALAGREADAAAPVRDDARIGAGAGEDWAGMTFAEAQATFWELEPLHLDMPPAAATVLADEVARRQGWSVMFSDPPGGQIEAVQRSFWYGLPADIAVRIVEAEGGSRVDVRSTSRLAGNDMGANAQRIKVLLDDLAQTAAVRAAGATGATATD